MIFIKTLGGGKSIHCANQNIVSQRSGDSHNANFFSAGPSVIHKENVLFVVVKAPVLQG